MEYNQFIGKVPVRKNTMIKFYNVLGLILIGLGLAVVFSLIFSLPIMWLWNGCLVPAVSVVHEIGWLQAWGLSFLFSMLFKSNTYSSSN
jgi:hypothetical protein